MCVLEEGGPGGGRREMKTPYPLADVLVDAAAQVGRLERRRGAALHGA